MAVFITEIDRMDEIYLLDEWMSSALSPHHWRYDGAEPRRLPSAKQHFWRIPMALSLSGERPSAAAMPINIFAVFARWFAKTQAARTRRTGLAALLDLDHSRLNDLGIDRQDVLEALRMNSLAASTRLTAARAVKARL
jgi:uncharacterized protein YjiS (DUF1127 family)